MEAHYAVVSADLHVGSDFGLWPKRYKVRGGWHELNRGQKYLLRGVWGKILDSLPGQLDFALFNGDLTEGKQPKNQGEDTVLTSTYHQREACKELIAPLIDRAKKIYVVRGTRYHEDIDAMEEFAASIGAVAGKDGIYCRPSARLKVGDIFIEARHKLGGAWLYLMAMLEREHRVEREAAEKKGYRADLIIGGHNHKFNLAQGKGWMGVTLPSMEIQTAWAEEKQANLWIPDLGVVLLHLYPGAKKQGRVPIFVEPLLYDHPLPEVLEVLET